MESEFSICVSQALEIWNSGLPWVSAIFWLSSATSRVVIPRRARRSLSTSLGGCEFMKCSYYRKGARLGTASTARCGLISRFCCDPGGKVASIRIRAGGRRRRRRRVREQYRHGIECLRQRDGRSAFRQEVHGGPTRLSAAHPACLAPNPSAPQRLKRRQR